MSSRLSAFVVTPASAGSHHGNRITALRWAKRLREFGFGVRIATEWCGEPCDVLIALHARRSHASIRRHADVHPDTPRIVALTGTDLYGDIQTDAQARESLELATRLVVLQPHGIAELPLRLHDRTRVIYQSAVAPSSPLRVAPRDAFVACVVAHFRDVKDPLLAARAILRLPERSGVRVVHVGAAHDEEWRAKAEDAGGASAGRWVWLGERGRSETLRILSSVDLLVVTSLSEGGANVVTEAIACGVPVISTRIAGSIGILGDDYPGYFEVADASGLASLLERCAIDAAFVGELRACVCALRPLVTSKRERETWANVLAELLLEP